VSPIKTEVESVQCARNTLLCKSTDVNGNLFVFAKKTHRIIWNESGAKMAPLQWVTFLEMCVYWRQK